MKREIQTENPFRGSNTLEEARKGTKIRNEREREKRIESTPSSTKFGFHSDGESPIEDLTGRMSRFAFPKAFNSSKAGHSGQIE